MKLLIADSRILTDIDISPYIPAEMELIISGGANGIDTLAERYADKHRISKLIIRPRYNLYRRAAPLKRNDLMVNICDGHLFSGTVFQREQNTQLTMLKRRANLSKS